VDRENEIFVPCMGVRAVAQLVETLRYNVPVSTPGIFLENFQATSFFRRNSVALGSTQTPTEISVGL
jgi:hypothetical protein